MLQHRSKAVHYNDSFDAAFVAVILAAGFAPADHQLIATTEDTENTEDVDTDDVAPLTPNSESLD
jgi:hypothetical protein